MGSGDRGGVVALSNLIAGATVRSIGSRLYVTVTRGRAGSGYLHRERREGVKSEAVAGKGIPYSL